MKPLYLESSVALAWLLGEPDSKKIVALIGRFERVVTSVLTLIECKRGLIRRGNDRFFKSSERQKLWGLLGRVSATWELAEISTEIQERATQTFPVEPLRTLDAIHLATILEIMKIYPELAVASFDKRILDNLEPLGLISANFEAF